MPRNRLTPSMSSSTKARQAASQPGGCAQCHAGLGAKPNPVGNLVEADYQNIDCLICHAPGYMRTVVKEGDRFRLPPDPAIGFLKAAQSAGRATSEMCLRWRA